LCARIRLSRSSFASELELAKLAKDAEVLPFARKRAHAGSRTDLDGVRTHRQGVLAEILQ
jgi:hypothetical protein